MKKYLRSYRGLITVISLLILAVFIILLITALHYRQLQSLQLYLLFSLVIIVFFAIVLVFIIFLRAKQLAFENSKYVEEEKETEAKAILESERRYHTLAESSPVGIFHTDATGYTTYVNPRWSAISGLTFEEALGNGWLNAVHTEDRELLREGWQEATKKQLVSSKEYRFVRPDGRTAWVLGQAVPEMSTVNEIVGYVGTITDITELKETEEIIKANEEKIKLIYNTTKDSLFLISIKNNRYYFSSVNQSFLETTGLTEEQVVGKFIEEIIPEPSLSVVVNNYQTSIDKRQTIQWEETSTYPTGIKTGIVTITPVFESDGKCCMLVGAVNDITERIKAEEEIARIYKEKETALNRINDGVISLDNDWHYTFLNDAAMATHPEGKNEVIGKTIWEVHPELLNTAFSKKYEEAMRTKNVVEFEDYYMPTDTWFFVKVYPSPDGLTIFYKDITEQKKAEEALNQNMIFIESIINASPDTIYVYDIEENKNSYVSEGVKRNIGYTENEIKEMENQLLPRLMHPDDFDYYLQHTYPLYQNLKDKEIISHEFRMKDKNGSWHWFYCKESIFTRKPDGTAKEIFGIISDITENKNAQEEIIKARDLSAAIINSLPGIFYLFNQEGKYLRWNKNLEIVSGYSAEEISRIHPLDFFDSDEKELLAKKISDTFKYGEANVEANFLLKNKNKIAYHFTGLFIKYEEANCLMGVGIDISERKEAQEKIQQTSEELRRLAVHLQTIREEERKRIGREIHDELGQQLTAIKMDVAWIDKKIPEETTVLKNKLRNIITLLDGSNKSIRRILSELRPGVLDDHDLVEALEWLDDQFTANTGIAVKFNKPEKIIKVPALVTICIFRVYQEALTNITRYAKAKTVSTALNIDNDNIVVSIEDDGTGFDITAVKNKKSFGILGMKERVHSLNGKFELVSSPGKGTKINISLPYDTSKNN